MRYKKLFILMTLSVVLLVSGCKKKYTPKPRGYFRIDFPEKEYSTYISDAPYAFDIPVYATPTKDNKNPNKSYWLNIEYPEFKGTIHLSYHKVDDNLGALLEDARRFVYKHTIKADAIGEQIYENHKEKVFGILYEIEGDAASSTQFFLTDSTDNFIRGALYFYAEPHQDSLAPVINFIKEDIRVIMESFKWK